MYVEKGNSTWSTYLNKAINVTKLQLDKENASTIKLLDAANTTYQSSQSDADKKVYIQA